MMQTAADLANLEEGTITVRHVNQLKEGRKNATLKDDADNLWLVAPHKLSLFEAGATYKIEFNEWKSKDGVLFRKIENARPVAPATPATTIRTPGLQTNGKKMDEFYKPKSPAEREEIAVLALLKSLIEAHQIGADYDQLVRAGKQVRNAYREIFSDHDHQSKE